MKISLICGSYGRPLRTLRLIKNVIGQNCDKADFEFLLIGDGCPVIKEFIDSGRFDAYPYIKIRNLPVHLGHAGDCVNVGIETATGDFICFVGNDDVIKHNHISEKLKYVYLYPDIDMFTYDTIIKVPGDIRIRFTKMQYGHIGHSEIVARTSIAKTVAPHVGDYGHDWIFIKNLISSISPERIKHIPESLTYEVRHMPGRGTFDKED